MVVVVVERVFGMRRSGVGGLDLLVRRRSSSIRTVLDARDPSATAGSRTPRPLESRLSFFFFFFKKSVGVFPVPPPATLTLTLTHPAGPPTFIRVARIGRTPRTA